MFRQALHRYISNFKGFSREVWILAIVTFINRAGTMVLPFLSKYLKEDLHFSYEQVGTIMIFFGLGSLLGSWSGGKLTNKVGFYKIMVFSLFTSGLLFFAIQYVKTFTGLCASMFCIMAIADMYRPAMFVSLNTYARPENRTRALTLVRLAINLGFFAGPALGGLIIINIGYPGLFWTDGSTCILSIVLFWLLVKEKKSINIKKEENTVKKQTVNPLKDISYLLFLFSSFTTALLFFQLFTTLPLYHKEWYGLSEFQTGLLMSFNGLMIFFMQMPIVGYLERKSVPAVKIILWGALLMAIAFFVLLFNIWAGILIVSMLFITAGEMFNFPFSNSFALGRAPKGSEGSYMAYYTMTFSLAHILSAKTGMEVIAAWGYNANWIVMGCIGILASSALIILHIRIIKESTSVISQE